MSPPNWQERACASPGARLLAWGSEPWHTIELLIFGDRLPNWFRHHTPGRGAGFHHGCQACTRLQQVVLNRMPAAFPREAFSKSRCWFRSIPAQGCQRVLDSASGERASCKAPQMAAI